MLAGNEPHFTPPCHHPRRLTGCIKLCTKTSPRKSSISGGSWPRRSPARRPAAFGQQPQRLAGAVSRLRPKRSLSRAPAMLGCPEQCYLLLLGEPGLQRATLLRACRAPAGVGRQLGARLPALRGRSRALCGEAGRGQDADSVSTTQACFTALPLF